MSKRTREAAKKVRESLIIKQPIKRIRPIAVIPHKQIDLKTKAQAAELTGYGDILCIEHFFGRMFRSDPAIVDDQIDRFIALYREACAKFDEEPTTDNADLLSYNDLYSLMGLLPNYAGQEWCYACTDEYRVDMEFRREMIEDSDWAAEIGEPYYLINPEEGSYPLPFNWYQ